MLLILIVAFIANTTMANNGGKPLPFNKNMIEGLKKEIKNFICIVTTTVPASGAAKDCNNVWHFYSVVGSCTSSGENCSVAFRESESCANAAAAANSSSEHTRLSNIGCKTDVFGDP